MAWADELRPDQAGIAGAERRHIALLAGPGTGKTFVLVRRVEHLVEVHDVSPSSITALTFTRPAAAEMRQRLIQRLGPTGRKVRVSTLHSYALRELLQQGAADIPMPVRIADDWEERWVVVEELAYVLGRTVPEIRNSRAEGALDRLANDWDTLAADGSGWRAGPPDPEFIGGWRRHREVYGYTLRSELVYQLLSELRSNPVFGPSRTTEVLLVDEYQDLNQCDLVTVALLSERAGAEVFSAGDDDQSIYSFRGAHPEGIRRFTADFAGATQLELSECLRCGPDIVDLANFVISQEAGRVPKSLVSRTDWTASVHLLRPANPPAEAASVARVVKLAIDEGTSPDEVLILAKSDRGGRISSAVAAALAKEGIDLYLPRSASDIPRDVQIFLEYLHLAHELAKTGRVDDLGGRALLELEDNGIGDGRLRRVLDLALDKSVRFLQALDIVQAEPGAYAQSRLPQVASARDEIVARANSMAQDAGESFDDWLDRVGAATGLTDAGQDLVRQVVDQAIAEVADKDLDGDGGLATEVGSAAGDQGLRGDLPTEPGSHVAELVAAMNGLSDGRPTAEAGKVTFTTMHGAKGLSADLVIVLQVEDEVIPGDLTGPQLDEARRLLYVSLTRARKQLVIMACLRRPGPQRYVGQTEVVGRTLSRFVRDYGLVVESVAEYVERTRASEGQ